MNTIFTYEVELKVTDKATGKAELVTRTEYAYSLMDAMHQALVQVTAGRAEISVEPMRVGPPAEAIRAAAQGTLNPQIATGLLDVFTRVGRRAPPTARDAVDPSAADPGTPAPRANS